jgi:glycosyltransferase involved in cell wall biosynthesis
LKKPAKKERGRRWLFLLAGDARKASSRVRGYWVADELRNAGDTCTLMVCTTPLRIFFAALLAPLHDVVVFQKTYSRHHRRLQRVCRRLGKTTYIDIDDAPSRTRNTATLENFRAMSVASTAVLAGNAVLAERARQAGARAELLPTGVRCRAYPVREHDGKAAIRVGWIGDARQYIHDLRDIVLPALDQLAIDREVILKVIGAGSQQLPVANGAYSVERVDDLDWSSTAAVAAQLQDVDIGVYPLLPNDFNDCKCGFKALEYMACGIPVVATPNPANREIIRHGIDGLLPDTPDEWRHALVRLADDTQMRRALGKAGRERVASLYDTKVIAGILMAIADADSPRHK